MSKKVQRRTYSGEFKQKVIEDMMLNKLGQIETARKHGISQSMINRWERIYLEEGVEGLYIERRGRACARSGTRKGRPPKLDKKVEEDLIAENQRLRAEIAYIKKLNALVLKEEPQSRKHK